MREQYRKAWTLIRWEQVDWSWDYAPRIHEEYDLPGAFEGLDVRAIGAAYINRLVEGRAPLWLEHGRFLALYQRKMEDKRHEEWLRRARNSVMVDKAEYAEYQRWLACQGQE